MIGLYAIELEKDETICTVVFTRDVGNIFNIFLDYRIINKAEFNDVWVKYFKVYLQDYITIKHKCATN